MAWSMMVLQQAMDLLLADPRYVQSNQTRKGMLRDKLATLVSTLFDGDGKDLPNVEEAAGAVLGATLGAPTTRNRSRRYVSPSTSPTPRGRPTSTQPTTTAAAATATVTYAIEDDDDDDDEEDEQQAANANPFDADMRRLLFDDETTTPKKKEKRKKTKAAAAHDRCCIDLRRVFMTLKDDTQALERFALACGDRARRAGVAGRSEADREAYRIRKWDPPFFFFSLILLLMLVLLMNDKSLIRGMCVFSCSSEGKYSHAGAEGPSHGAVRAG
ncbi:hypothetical protein F4775DRAFT_543070 [Biscogniauxia sp. FL1348]|nr:hypothetical protein F4775DRAFT_543070 [Biscogniauxia sp. FL1348]